MKLEKAIHEFLKHYESNGKVSSRSYRPCLEKFKRYSKVTYLSEIRLPQTTDKVIQELLQSPLDQNTNWYVMTVVRIFVRYWVDQGELDVNPRMICIPKRIHKRQRAIKEDEHRKIINSINPSNFYGLRDIALLMMLYDTGMRVSEIAQMKVADMDFKLDICKIVTAKTRAEDIVCWSKETSDFLIDLYLPIRNELQCSKEFLFVSKLSRNSYFKDGINRRTIQRIVRQHSLKCGFNDITPHKYRHGKAYSIHEKGGTLADIKNILRHSSINSSLTYLNMFERDNQERMKKFL